MSYKYGRPLNNIPFTAVIDGEEITITGDEICLDITNNAIGLDRATWLKVMRKKLATIAGLAKSAFLTVLIYILSITRYTENRFNCSQVEIANSTGLSRPAVSKAFTLLLEYDIIRVYKPGEYMINPGYLYAGTEAVGEIFREKFKHLPKYSTSKTCNKNKNKKEKNINGTNSDDLRHIEDLRDSGSGYDENETDHIHT